MKRGFEKSIQEKIIANCNNFPDRTAFRFNDEKFSYQDLNKESIKYVNFLKSNDFNFNSTIAIKGDYSFDLVTLLFAILRSGGNYLLLKSQYPINKDTSVLEELNITQLLTDRKPEIENDSFKIINFREVSDLDFSDEEFSDYESKESDLIFTQIDNLFPEGISAKSITQRVFGKYNSLRWDYDTSKKLQGITILEPKNSELFSLELLSGLAEGATVELITNDFKKKLSTNENSIESISINSDFYNELIENNKLTVLINSDKDELRELVLFVNDPITKKTFDQLKEFADKTEISVKIINNLGSSGTYISATRLSKEDSFETKIAENLKLYLLDNRLQPTPKGVSGKLFIGGEFEDIANNTSENIVENPFENDGSYLLETGITAKFNLENSFESFYNENCIITFDGDRYNFDQFRVDLLNIDLF